MTTFKDAKSRLEGLERANLHLLKEIRRTTDWRDVEEIALYHQAKRQKERNLLLDRLVPDRRCPSCGLIKVKSRQWAVSEDERIAVCKSCFGQVRNYTTTPAIFPRKERRWKIGRIRREIAVSQLKIPWEREYYYMLENGVFDSVSDATKKTLDEVEGISLVDWEEVFRYVLDGQMLARARVASGQTQTNFALKIGWGRSYQQRLEYGNQRTVDSQTATDILETLKSFGHLTEDQL